MGSIAKLARISLTGGHQGYSMLGCRSNFRFFSLCLHIDIPLLKLTTGKNWKNGIIRRRLG
jgi:hypothetical protein